MALKFGDIASGGSYFKGDDFASAVALLIEPKHIDPQVPTKFGPKDTLTADITAFGTVAEIDADGGTLTTGIKIQQIDLVKKLAHLVGSATVVTVVKLPPSSQLPNGAWVWRAVDADVRGKVIAFAERREAAAAAAIEEMPDFAA
ncbi:hypothetical protein [Cellulomonas sp. SG140]|uniref:hypothetical protein n=1 Tax=Cellulomonas sp. SG140 TaxID=2976536 RepID=UPI0021E8AC6D|nr:hypothetical protein [Cellulomonas sp. SG140]